MYSAEPKPRIGKRMGLVILPFARPDESANNLMYHSLVVVGQTPKISSGVDR